MPQDIIPESLRQGADKVIETSCAYVVLRGNEAFKIKKPVDYGFLDYSTREKRNWALLRELDYNRLTSDDIYRSVDYYQGEPVLRMRRFDDQAVLANRFDAQEAVDLGLMDLIGKVIATFHAKTDLCRDHVHRDNTAYVIDSNRGNIALFATALGKDLVEHYDLAITKAYLDVKDDVLKRMDDGFIRRCHGDLHLGNILIEAQRPILFDCIEFNDRLINIDVLYDLAFILMDLWVRGQGAAANRVMNAWFEAMTRQEDDLEALYASLKLLPLYLSVRAAVRCHVNAHAVKSDMGLMAVARNYLQAAIDFLNHKPPMLMAIGGLSGSGKSYQARKVAESCGRPVGAIIVRSDEVRKRLWGIENSLALPPEAYGPEHTQATLQEILRSGQSILKAGQSLIIDATFRDPMWREAVETLATDCGVTFCGIWLDVDETTRLQRVALRENDISDADVAIAQMQSGEVQLSKYWSRKSEITL